MPPRRSTNTSSAAANRRPLPTRTRRTPLRFESVPSSRPKPATSQSPSGGTSTLSRPSRGRGGRVVIRKSTRRVGSSSPAAAAVSPPPPPDDDDDDDDEVSSEDEEEESSSSSSSSSHKGSKSKGLKKKKNDKENNNDDDEDISVKSSDNDDDDDEPVSRMAKKRTWETTTTTSSDTPPATEGRKRSRGSSVAAAAAKAMKSHEEGKHGGLPSDEEEESFEVDDDVVSEGKRRKRRGSATALLSESKDGGEESSDNKSDDDVVDDYDDDDEEEKEVINDVDNESIQSSTSDNESKFELPSTPLKAIIPSSPHNHILIRLHLSSPPSTSTTPPPLTISTPLIPDDSLSSPSPSSTRPRRGRGGRILPLRRTRQTASSSPPPSLDDDNPPPLPPSSSLPSRRGRRAAATAAAAATTHQMLPRGRRGGRGGRGRGRGRGRSSKTSSPHPDPPASSSSGIDAPPVTPVKSSSVADLPSSSAIPSGNDGSSPPVIGDDGNLFFCHICKEVGEVVCCDGCPSVYHPQCLPEGKSRMSLENDDDPWYCPTCFDRKTGAKDDVIPVVKTEPPADAAPAAAAAVVVTKEAEESKVKVAKICQLATDDGVPPQAAATAATGVREVRKRNRQKRKCSDCLKSGGKMGKCKGCKAFLHVDCSSWDELRDGRDDAEDSADEEGQWDDLNLTCTNCRAEQVVEEAENKRKKEEENTNEDEHVEVKKTTDDENDDDDDDSRVSHDDQIKLPTAKTTDVISIAKTTSHDDDGKNDRDFKPASSLSPKPKVKTKQTAAVSSPTTKTSLKKMKRKNKRKKSKDKDDPSYTPTNSSSTPTRRRLLSPPTTPLAKKRKLATPPSPTPRRSPSTHHPLLHPPPNSKRPVKAAPAFFFYLLENRPKIEKQLLRQNPSLRRTFASHAVGTTLHLERYVTIAREGARLWNAVVGKSEKKRFQDLAMKDFGERVIAWKTDDMFREAGRERGGDGGEDGDVVGDVDDEGSETSPRRDDDRWEDGGPARRSSSSPSSHRPKSRATHPNPSTTIPCQPLPPSKLNDGCHPILIELLQDARFHPIPMVHPLRPKSDFDFPDHAKMTVPYFEVQGPIATSVGDECLGCTRGWCHFCPILKRQFPAVEHRAKLQPPVSSLAATRIGLGLMMNNKRKYDDDENNAADQNMMMGMEDQHEGYYWGDGESESLPLSQPSSRADDIVQFVEEAMMMKIGTVQQMQNQEMGGPGDPQQSYNNNNNNNQGKSNAGSSTAASAKDVNWKGGGDDGTGTMSATVYECGGCQRPIHAPVGCIDCRRRLLIQDMSKRQPVVASAVSSSLSHAEGAVAAVPGLSAIPGSNVTGASSTGGKGHDQHDSSLLTQPRNSNNNNNNNNSNNNTNNKDNNNTGFLKLQTVMLGRAPLKQANFEKQREGDRAVSSALSGLRWKPNVIMPNKGMKRALPPRSQNSSFRRRIRNAMSQFGSDTSSDEDDSDNSADDSNNDPKRTTKTTTSSRRTTRLPPPSTNFTSLPDHRQALALAHKAEAAQLHKKCLSLLTAGILLGLLRRDPLRLFAEPVPLSIKKYREVIKQPMDFKTIRRKVLDGTYTSLGSFANDARVLCRNAMIFNRPGSIYYHTAQQLLDKLEIMQKRGGEWIKAINGAHASSFAKGRNGKSYEPFELLNKTYKVGVEVLEEGEWLLSQVKADVIRTKENEGSYYGCLAVRRAATAAAASLAGLSTTSSEADGTYLPCTSADNSTYLPCTSRGCLQDELLRRTVDARVARLSDPLHWKDEIGWREESVLQILRRVQKRRVEGRVASRSGCARCDGASIDEEARLAMIAEAMREKRDCLEQPVSGGKQRIAKSRLYLSTGLGSERERRKRGADDREGDGNKGDAVMPSADAPTDDNNNNNNNNDNDVNLPDSDVNLPDSDHNPPPPPTQTQPPPPPQIQPPLTGVSVRGSRIHGWGLFADHPFKKGDVVAEYVGEYISNPVADARETMYQERRIQDYQFRVGNDLVIDATLKGGHARYINHKCDPNCIAKIVDGEPPNRALKRVIIESQRDIDAMEEITYDYQFPLELDLNKRIPCNCGSDSCRGFMNWDLPEKGSNRRLVNRNTRNLTVGRYGSRKVKSVTRLFKK